MTVSIPSATLVPLKRLKGAEYNPRVMPDAEMQRLMASIKEFGFVQPIVARKEDGLILGGHQRCAAYRRMLSEEGMTATQAGEQKVPVVLVENLDDERAKLLNLALNKISGEWDYDRLGELLNGLAGVDVNLELSGFAQTEIDDILALTNTSAEDIEGQEPPKAEEPAEDPDAALELAVKFPSADEARAFREALKEWGAASDKDAFKALKRMAAAAGKRAKKKAPAEAAQEAP